MRISTPAMHYRALTAMQSQQATLSKTQNQIATGKRVQTPADDPVASVGIMELERALKESEQFGRNADMAVNRLSLEEQAIADVGSLLLRVRELAVQGNNATIDAANRRVIATELRGRLQDLVNIANKRDANNEFLFSGFASLTQPFAQSGASISYFGDQGARQLAVGPNQRVADGHSGFDVFMNVAEGNGVFVTSASAANTGSGVISGPTGDLRLGLPWQSIGTRDGLHHEPLRLLVVVDAPRERIDRIIDSAEIVADLVHGEWVIMVRPGPAPGAWERRTREGWQPYALTTSITRTDSTRTDSTVTTEEEAA